MKKERFSKKMISRREFLRGIGLGATGLYLSGCVVAPAPSQAPAAAPKEEEGPKEFSWKMAEGQEVAYLGLKSGPEDFWQELVPEFEELTGIATKFEAFEQAQARQKLATEFTAGTTNIDTFRTVRGQDFAQYSKNGWYEALDPYINDPAMVAPDFDLGDFFEGALNACTLDGTIIALPVLNGGQCMFVRRDLLDEKGLEIPTNFDELEAAAKALHNPPDVYGFVSRGQKSSAVSMFAAFLHNMGADWMGADGKTPSLNTPEAIAAYEFYGGLLRDYAPPGINNMANIELVPFFQQGQAAMYPDDVLFRNLFEDEESSKVVGNVAYAHFPAGPARDTPTIYVYGVAVSSQSDNKLPAWLWTQYLASKDVQIRGMARGIAAGRKSAWDDPEALATAPEDWIETCKWTFETGDDHWAPPVISVPEARDIVGTPITVAIEGGDVKAACERANEELAALAKRDGVI